LKHSLKTGEQNDRTSRPFQELILHQEHPCAVSFPTQSTGRDGIVLENEAHLIEAAFGRIKLFGGVARTALDEPFVLKAAKAFFRESDPLLLADAEQAVLHSTNASVHGNMWENI
jgi:hypothetical protein